MESLDLFVHTWIYRVVGSCAPGTRILISSSRRPGLLELDLIDSRLALDLPAETFLPLWPLDRFFSAAEIFPGTSIRKAGIGKDVRPPSE